MAIYTDYPRERCSRKAARAVTSSGPSPTTPRIQGQAGSPTGVAIHRTRRDDGDQVRQSHLGNALLRERDRRGHTRSSSTRSPAGLILATAETDQAQRPGESSRAMPACSTGGGGPALPAGTVAIANLAAQVRINPAADPAQGGDLTTIRDGGMNGAAYDYNPANAASFSGRLQGLLVTLDAQQPFDATAGVNPSTTLGRFAAGSVGWLEAARKQADKEAAYQTTFLERTSESLSNETGVNLDEELAMMLELERSYGASARIIGAVDAMLASLLEAVR